MDSNHDNAPRTRRRVLALASLAIGLAAASAPLSSSSAAFTSRSVNPGSIGAAPDWTPPTVTLDVPDMIRGSVSITAAATDSRSSIARVEIQWSPGEAGTWTTLCTRTAAPYTCTLNTVGMPEDDIDVRATATDAAGFSASVVETGILVDNIAPTASLGTVPNTLTGVVTIPVNASDAGSGVSSATVQYAPAGTTSWTTICVDTTAPWSCRWDTTTAAFGSYDLRAIVADVAGNTMTTASLTKRQVDNRAASVSVEHPGAFLRGTATIAANAFSNAGVTSVRIQRSPVGSTTWTDICTDSTSPYSCDWNTATVADGDYNLRAVLLDGANTTTTSATVGPVRVDNSPLRGFDVQGTNGTNIGRLDAGDTLTTTYTRRMRSTSFLAGWDGTRRAVVLRVRDGSLLGLGSAEDTLDVFTTTTLGTQVQIGSINLKGDYVRTGKTITIAGTMTQTTTIVNGLEASAVTLAVGTSPATKQKDLRTTSLVPTMVWSPSAQAVDISGVATSAAPVTELGAADRDL